MQRGGVYVCMCACEEVLMRSQEVIKHYTIQF